MGKTKVKESKKPLTLSKVVVYILLILLAITIIIPVIRTGKFPVIYFLFISALHGI